MQQNDDSGSAHSGNALFTVFNKRDTPEFAAALHKMGWTIYASGGTAKAIGESKTADGLGTVPVIDIAAVIGASASKGHLVVTASREVAMGLVTPDTTENRAALKAQNIPFIDLYVCNFYDLEENISTIRAAEAENPVLWPRKLEVDQQVIDHTDVGGPSNLMFALKGGRMAICHIDQYDKVLNYLRGDGADRATLVNELRAEGYSRTARYYGIAAEYWGADQVETMILRMIKPLAYAENRQMGEAALYGDFLFPSELSRAGNLSQTGALPADALPTDALPTDEGDPLDLMNFKLVDGAEPGYITMTDADGALRTLTHIAAAFGANAYGIPYIAVAVKHGNCCGVGVAKSTLEATIKMVEGHPGDLLGATVMTNFVVDAECAMAMKRHALILNSPPRAIDSVWAAGFTDEAVTILPRKDGKYRLMANMNLLQYSDTLDPTPLFRMIRARKFLVQSNYNQVLHIEDFGEQLPHGTPTAVKRDLLISSAICRTSVSNTITIVKDGMLLGNGVGQMSRARAAKLAVMISDEASDLSLSVSPAFQYRPFKLNGALAVSDSFFPFPDGAAVLVEAGIRTIFATEGGRHFPEVQQYCREHDVLFLTLPDNEARMFARH